MDTADRNTRGDVSLEFGVLSGAAIALMEVYLMGLVRSPAQLLLPASAALLGGTVLGALGLRTRRVSRPRLAALFLGLLNGVGVLIGDATSGGGLTTVLFLAVTVAPASVLLSILGASIPHWFKTGLTAK